jgi:sorting nexin-25
MSPSLQESTQAVLRLPYTYAIIATLAAILLGSYLGSNFLLRAWLFSSVTTSLAVLAALGFHHIVVSHQNQPSNFPRRTFKPFRFTAPDKYPVAIRNLRAQSAFPKEFREPLVPGQQNISDQLNSLLRLVMRDFLNEWFDTISDDAAFPISVEKAIRTAIINLRIRLETNITDPTDILVRKFLPMFTSHLSDFTNAEKAVRGTKILTESEEVDRIVATKYGQSTTGGLHPATAITFSDPTLPQQEWLRALMERILPLVMPEKEAKSRAVLVLVREIVACAVLYPVIRLLADPDVWNQLIEHVAASAIQDRRKVKKFRAALSKQLDSPSKKTKDKFDVQLKKLVQYNEEETYESLKRLCQSCQILSDARRLRSDLIILISKVEAYKGMSPKIHVANFRKTCSRRTIKSEEPGGSIEASRRYQTYP